MLNGKNGPGSPSIRVEIRSFAKLRIIIFLISNEVSVVDRRKLPVNAK